ncbi:GNAT family N-acetyltransferase [Aquabacterium sp.]|uniref:GNAT family N-acetyltransferase n=1 Tax=Aquabacterium sp. TaxID=1872578 RepID=UPI002C3EE082|nr:GNAT family N-acetyltransferase [Aquabacterium sp.]HSW04849.1 GNAT family N-acetyltransferase [Aquabacterium sp.]
MSHALLRQPAKLRRLEFGPGQGGALLATPAGEPHDELVLRHCSHEVGMLALFDAADLVLTAQGAAVLVVQDRFVLQRASTDQPGHHALDAFLALAQRMGWVLADRVELGRDGPCGEYSLRFERAAPPSDRLHPVGATESGAMRALFAHVFGHEMTPAHWHWKYGEGRGFAAGLSRDGELVAHYGGCTRSVLWAGRPVTACQVCDVMVAPAANSALVRKGTMHQVTTAFLESEIGWGQRHVLAFGFPSDRHHALARLLGLYDGVDSMLRASWPATPPAQSPGLSSRALQHAELAPGSRHAAAVQRLWQQMAAAFSGQLIGVRDAAWLRHRYLAHPSLNYDVLLLRRRWTRRPVGVLVLRTHERHLDVLDLVAPPSAWPALIAIARQRAAAAGLERVDLWITQSQKHQVAGIDAPALTLIPLNITVPSIVHTPGPAVDELRDRWLLLAGDADFT